MIAPWTFRPSMVLASEDSGMKREAVAATLQVVDQDADPALQRRRRADHALGLVEHDARLIAGGGGGVDLGALLAVGDQQVEADAGRERALAVLPRHRAIGGAEAPQTVRRAASRTGSRRRTPARARARRSARPTRPWSGEGSRRSRSRAARPREVEAQSAGCGRGQVVEMTLAGQTDEAVGEDLPLGHGPRVGRDRVVSGVALATALQERLERVLRAPSRRPGCGCASSGSCRARRRSGP